MRRVQENAATGATAEETAAGEVINDVIYNGVAL